MSTTELQHLDPWVRDFLRQVSPEVAAVQVPQVDTTAAEASSDPLEVPHITTDAQLADYVWSTWGVRVPNVRVCPHHDTPWQAFSDIYFARHPMSVIKGSRGLAGKTFLSALLGNTVACTLKADVTILGGSGAQSNRLHKAMGKFWSAPNAPRHLLKGDLGVTKTKFVWGNEIEALTASQKSVRGPHPQMLLLDEIDEMDIGIFDSAMGQTMSARGIPARTAAFSTHQYDDGTMSEVLKRAAEKGWRVYEWCYKETLEPHGWLLASEVARKRAEMTKIMWDTEIELQEPSPEGRAIDTDKVERMFYGEKIESPVGDGQFPYREFEPPVEGAAYATGADWARTQDYVEIATLRVDVLPMRLVAYQRFRKRPTPLIINAFDQQKERYKSEAAHDATGGGTYIADFLDEGVKDVVMVGMRRKHLFMDYIVAIENEEIVAPRIEVLYKQHRNVKNLDLWTNKGHPPDGFVACSLAYDAAGSARRPLRVLSAVQRPQVVVVSADKTAMPPVQQQETGLDRALSFLGGGGTGDGK